MRVRDIYKYQTPKKVVDHINIQSDPGFEPETSSIAVTYTKTALRR